MILATLFAATLGLTPFIFGGTDVVAGDPIANSTVYIQGKFLHASFTCSGALVAPDLVMTAGHCLGGGGFADLVVYFGPNGTDGGIKVIKQVRKYEVFSQAEFDRDDVALLRLAQPAPAAYVPAVILDDPALVRDGADIILAGFGIDHRTPEDGNAGVGKLRSVEQKILTGKYGNTEVLIDIKERGACSGDSGGPAFVKRNNQLLLFGIASRLTARDRMPDVGREARYDCNIDIVYSNILAFAEWFKQAEAELRQ
jgi:secreted trypsin-like serine protease